MKYFKNLEVEDIEYAINKAKERGHIEKLKIVSPDEYRLIKQYLDNEEKDKIKMSTYTNEELLEREEQALADKDNLPKVGQKSESISKTALKTIKRMTKDALVNMVLQISNYAELQKAQNIILLKMVEDLKLELSKAGAKND